MLCVASMFNILFLYVCVSRMYIVFYLLFHHMGDPIVVNVFGFAHGVDFLLIVFILYVCYLCIFFFICGCHCVLFRCVCFSLCPVCFRVMFIVCFLLVCLYRFYFFCFALVCHSCMVISGGV